MEDRKFLGTEKIGSLLFKLALPTVVAQLVNMLYNIVDRIYIGHIEGTGALALTGVGVCLPLILIVSAFAALISSGGGPRASIMMGHNDYDKAEEVLGNSFIMQVMISVVLTLILLIFNEDILLLFGASENTIGYATTYMDIYAVGTIFVQLTLGMNSFITAQGFAKTSMLSTLYSFLFSIWESQARPSPLSSLRRQAQSGFFSSSQVGERALESEGNTSASIRGSASLSFHSDLHRS